MQLLVHHRTINEEKLPMFVEKTSIVLRADSFQLGALQTGRMLQVTVLRRLHPCHL